MQFEQVSRRIATPFAFRALVKPGFHLQMLCVAVVILTITVIGCQVIAVHVPDAENLFLPVGLMAVVACAMCLYLKERGWVRTADSVLTILWGVFFYVVLNFPVTIAARLGMGNALYDSSFLRLDGMLGVSVPAIASWFSRHGMEGLMSSVYSALIPLLWSAILLPTLTGRAWLAQRFMAANLVAFALGLPLFALFPAVGPWYGFHLVARPDEAACQALLELIRTPGIYTYHLPAGIICFPSFHVIWAILGAYALWGFRWMRVPVAMLATAIVVSTLATGVHYLVDVIGGIVLASISIAVVMQTKHASKPASV